MKKASFKLRALWRIRRYLTVEKARLIANEFIHSQFNYGPLIQMFASNEICKIHHRALQMVHNKYDRSYEELLQLDSNPSRTLTIFGFGSFQIPYTSNSRIDVVLL